MAESTYTVDAACQNCGWGGKLAIRFGEKAPTGGIAGSKRTCDRCGVYAVTTMSDERRKGVDMRPCAGDEVNAAWAEVNRLRSRLAEVEQERDRLRSECAVCEKCGHVQAEPNWCHECGHRTTAPGWAKPLLDAFFERNDLAERAERAEAALRQLEERLNEWVDAHDAPLDTQDDEPLAVFAFIGDHLRPWLTALASVSASLDAPKEQP